LDMLLDEILDKAIYTKYEKIKNDPMVGSGG
jgi:hypothetical protein